MRSQTRIAALVLLTAVAAAPAMAQTRFFPKGDSGWTLSDGGHSGSDVDRISFNRGLLGTYTYRGIVDVGTGFVSQYDGYRFGAVFARVALRNPGTMSGWGIDFGLRYDLHDEGPLPIYGGNTELRQRTTLATVRAFLRRELSPSFSFKVSLAGFHCFDKLEHRDAASGEVYYGSDEVRIGTAADAACLVSRHLYVSLGMMYAQQAMSSYYWSEEAWGTNMIFRLGVVFGLQNSGEVTDGSR